MPDLDDYRSITDDLRPPAFDALRATARARSRLTAALTAAGTVAAAVVVALAAMTFGGTERGDDVVVPGTDLPSQAPELNDLGEIIHSPAPGEVFTLTPASGGRDELRAGRYALLINATSGYQIDVPDHWKVVSGRFLNGPDTLIHVAPAGNDTTVPTQPCTDRTPKPVGPAVTDLVRAIRAQPLLRVGAPEQVTLGGLPATYLQIGLPGELDSSRCVDGDIALFATAEDGWSLQPDYRARVHSWILEVDHRRVVVMAMCDRTCTDARMSELQAITESMTFTD